MLSERCLKIHFILNNCAGWGREGTFRVANCRLGRIFAAFSNAILGACSQPPDGQTDGRTGGAGRCGGLYPWSPQPRPRCAPPPLPPARDARCGARGWRVGAWRSRCLPRGLPLCFCSCFRLNVSPSLPRPFPRRVTAEQRPQSGAVGWGGMGWGGWGSRLRAPSPNSVPTASSRPFPCRWRGGEGQILTSTLPSFAPHSGSYPSRLGVFNPFPRTKPAAPGPHDHPSSPGSPPRTPLLSPELLWGRGQVPSEPSLRGVSPRCFPFTSPL